MPVPIEFLLECSAQSLRDFQLNSLNRAANVRKTIKTLHEEMVRLECDALFAQWLTENRADLMSLGRTDALQKILDFSGSYGPNRQPLADPV